MIQGSKGHCFAALFYCCSVGQKGDPKVAFEHQPVPLMMLEEWGSVRFEFNVCPEIPILCAEDERLVIQKESCSLMQALGAFLEYCVIVCCKQGGCNVSFVRISFPPIR